MLSKNINSPATTSMGRLFDAVSAILGVRMKSSFEGQSAMEVEYRAHKSSTNEVYSIALIEKNGLIEWDWRSMVEGILKDINEELATFMRYFLLFFYFFIFFFN